MTHPLDGARTKVDRAKENIVNLATECQQFIDKNYRHDLIAQSQVNPLEYLVAYPPVPKPAIRLAVLVGEVLYLLRSSLDHVVGQLILLRDPTSTLYGSQFPICTETRRHKAMDCGKVKAIPDEAAAAIMKLQPCYGRNEPSRTHKLAVLNSLRNFDKHRLVVLLGGAAALSKWDVQVTAKGHAGFKVVFPKFDQPVFLSHDNATPMGVVNVVPSGDPTHVDVAYVKVKQQFSLHVSIENTGLPEAPPLVPFLQSLQDDVFKIVRDFARFF